jgi:hypothetical protein
MPFLTKKYLSKIIRNKYQINFEVRILNLFQSFLKLSSLNHADNFAMKGSDICWSQVEDFVADFDTFFKVLGLLKLG